MLEAVEERLVEQLVSHPSVERSSTSASSRSGHNSAMLSSRSIYGYYGGFWVKLAFPHRKVDARAPAGSGRTQRLVTVPKVKDPAAQPYATADMWKIETA